MKAYSDLGIDPAKALEAALKVPISIHCWQADDVAGLEAGSGVADSGGIKATGNYPGRARNGDEMRMDFEKVISLVPGAHRVNLHAFYAEPGKKKVDRDAMELSHFQNWVDWAKSQKIALDFNPTYFAHAKAADGFTLSSSDESVRKFWVKHGIASRKIAAAMGKAQGGVCV
ncbi:MAG: L-rhamnose isomerase, partial [Candidatus Methylacidiphilales bacterium]